MEAKRQLEQLLRIQELVTEIRAATDVLEKAPGRIDEIEAAFRDRNTEYVAVKDRHDALETDRKHRIDELETLEAQRDKFMEDLSRVVNQREYAAMLKEIDSVKAMIAEHEDAVLVDMEEIEKIKVELQNHEDHIKAERVLVERDRAAVEGQVEVSRKRVGELNAERERIESELPKNMLGTIHRLETTRQGIFLSKADNGTCLSCFVRVRPQQFQEIKIASKIHSCSNCRRFLYYEPVLRAATPKPEAVDAANVETVNGGAA